MKKLNYHRNIYFILLILITTTSCKDKNTKKDTPPLKNQDTISIKETALFSKVDPANSGINFINYNKENKDFNYYQYEYF